VCGVHGVRGWVKVFSYTEPRENIAQFEAWLLRQRDVTRRVEVQGSSSQGKNILVKLDGVDDRDAAEALIGAEITVERDSLPPCSPGEYYWTDLEGLSVRNGAGDVLGTVDHLFTTGAHDMLALDGERRRLIPFVAGETVRRVDLEAGVVIVEWDSSYWE
jgi:16S rRNA processing protein RimM